MKTDFTSLPPAVDGSPFVLVITGPTATGKTALGVQLALNLNGEVVSADSMQLYRHMDIGTAKPRPEETLGITHHMIDIVSPRTDYSVARYVEDAGTCIDDILARGKLPILVGGTGLYIESLLSGRSFADTDGDEKLRESLDTEYEALGGEAMLKRLFEFDPQRGEKLNPRDKRRIIRAIEVYMLTGKTITQHDLETQTLPPRYPSFKLALSFDSREDLYKRIDLRVDEMLRLGLVTEVQSLLDSGVPKDCTAMQAIGYKELVSHLLCGSSLEEAAEIIKRESRRYAKRQLTWLRRDKSVNWILWDAVPDIDNARQLLTNFFLSWN